STGLIFQVIALPWARQERTCLTRLFQRLSKDDLLLGDRGLVGFVHLAMLLQHRLCGLIRLPYNQAIRRRGRTGHQVLRRLGKQDLLVCWPKGRRPAWLSRRRFTGLPACIDLRQIAFSICRKGHRTQWAYLITTLVDPEKYP